jgi:hypothetical protein
MNAAGQPVVMYPCSGMWAFASGSVGAVAVAACLAATPAIAKGPVPPGVHIDPGSPAGKQYQIPIPAARQETSGATGSGSGASANPPLFGVGVNSPASGSTGGRVAPRRARNATAKRKTARRNTVRGKAAPARTVRSGTRSRRDVPTSSSGPSTRVEKASQVGSNGWVPLVAGGGLVLLLGGGGGLGLRRRYLRA